MSSNATLGSHNNVVLDISCVPGYNTTVNDIIALNVSFNIVPIPKLKPTKRNNEESENITSSPYKIRIEESVKNVVQKNNLKLSKKKLPLVSSKKKI